MSIELHTPQDIYARVSARVDAILQSLGSGSDDPDVLKAKKNAEGILHKFQGELHERIASLEQHAEWDSFTVAFYGETNAGKSTIIETLRIMLGEQSKAEEQQLFTAQLAEYRIAEQRVDDMRAALADSEALCTELDAGYEDLERKHHEQKARLDEELAILQRVIAEKKENAALWRRILNIVVKLPEEKQSAQLNHDANALAAEKNRESQALQQQLQDARNKNAAAEQAFQQAEAGAQAARSNLEKYADGAIIGNGRSDFTTETHAYPFAIDEQKFALLDVPGIEGKEQTVIDSIWAAVNKAHAVFYVTGKAAAPQTGDENQKGTLEKIKEHLGAQTEVWTIFNKRITNPVQLKSDSLVSDDEQESLRDLDDKMREQLGDNYRGVVTLSAQPAFLAVAECLPPGSLYAKSKAKFMSGFSARELQLKSRATDFYRLLTSDLVKDHKVKIVRSNYNKANQLVKELTGNVDALLSNTFKPLGRKLAKDADGAQSQIDVAARALKTRLESQGERAISKFSNAVRSKIYKRIEDDISNDDFKAALERTIRNEQECMVKDLPGSMNREIEKFQADISETIERFQEHTADLLEAYSRFRTNEFGGGFNLNIKIDNGINVPGLLGAVAGAALMIWNPAGWAMLAVGAVTVILGAVKAAWGFFSSDYKKSQQRKSADENLETLNDSMRDSMRDNLKAALPQLEQKVEALKTRVEAPAREIAEISAILKKTGTELNKLSKTLERAGAM